MNKLCAEEQYSRLCVNWSLSFFIQPVGELCFWFCLITPVRTRSLLKFSLYIKVKISPIYQAESVAGGNSVLICAEDVIILEEKCSLFESRSWLWIRNQCQHLWARRNQKQFLSMLKKWIKWTCVSCASTVAATAWGCWHFPPYVGWLSMLYLCKPVLPASQMNLVSFHTVCSVWVFSLCVILPFVFLYIFQLLVFL